MKENLPGVFTEHSLLADAQTKYTDGSLIPSGLMAKSSLTGPGTMKQIPLKLSVSESAELIKTSLQKKGFTLFSDIDHQANAKSVDLDMPASRVLIFGNPVAGTQLMKKDIAISLDLPLRLALVEKDGQTIFIHQTAYDYSNNYQVEDHPVLEKIEALYAALASELG
jgi:uncharacterized protein (DUF302 family)